MMRMLVSVRSLDEAWGAVQGGADFIDLKEPSQGALGGLPVDVIRDIVAALRAGGVTLKVSATIGDLPMRDVAAILDRVARVAACGVDYVKVGLTRGDGSLAVMQALAGCGVAVIPVLIADKGVDDALVEAACLGPFPGVMLDTADKLAGSLFDCVPAAELQRFIGRVRAAGKMSGLAGALRAADLRALGELGPDFAGFRSAVCEGDRRGVLDPLRVIAMRQNLRAGLARGELSNGESVASFVDSTLLPE